MTTPVTERAREMRKTMTPPEARLWVVLRRLRARGFHFRRQVPFRGDFLDFACHGQRLVVEVDGLSHEGRSDHDRLRDAVLTKEGYRTLRFSNADVRDNLEEVLEGDIAALELTGPTRSLRDHPPHKGEGE